MPNGTNILLMSWLLILRRRALAKDHLNCIPRIRRERSNTYHDDFIGIRRNTSFLWPMVVTIRALVEIHGIFKHKFDSLRLFRDYYTGSLVIFVSLSISHKIGLFIDSSISCKRFATHCLHENLRWTSRSSRFNWILNFALHLVVRDRAAIANQGRK